MDLPELYPTVILLVSIFIALVWAADVVKTARAFRRWHDERAARNLLLSIVFFVAAMGLAISATGFIPTEGGPILAVTGLGIARGALLVGGIVLIVSGRPDRKESEGDDQEGRDHRRTSDGQVSTTR